ncbi:MULTISPECIES: type II toxin-antitoxin system RelE/ParE family toxin [Nostoc]|uniref:Type II toxin-antitoxin system RelE/ParE family toxin n=1 Tax=Nostoc paludosum FACHB-159 TaxID=2692908 RepID=A0ABR8KJS7_9NOSO|nr:MULTISPECIES: type II toxin-antitoxin system RelE/ParE family toxin [Nostoc]MBD2682137.1 type II toxin-antitoxin system RelE/ParE family toxin [Nostoc sp. FACHB-857]MBD2738443.1 type II toxin-antitoxin system RelE/ParE family toxin [Nostoc paludosum FACHB-159]
MSHYTFTPLAVSDLDNIYEYIASNDLPILGRLLNRFTELFRKLAAMPGIGRNRAELGEGIKSFPSGNYVIFYRTVEGGIEIMRVLHGARDIEKIFAQDTEFTQGD